MVDEVARSESERSARWFVCNQKLPKVEVIYFIQVILIYIVVVTCLINLSLGWGNQALWSSLLSGGLGYILPSPKLRKNNEPFLSHTAQ
jgi:hypothetical protein